MTGGRHTVRALSQEVWSSELVVVNPARSSGHRAICAPPSVLVSAASETTQFDGSEGAP